MNQIRANARKFSLDWKNESSEKSESQTFWNEFFAVFGVNRRQVGVFEAAFKKMTGAQGFIDVYWPKMLVCEQKSRGKNLEEAAVQALGYLQSIAKVKQDDLPRYMIVCDFEHLHLLDLETQQEQRILVAELAENIELFGFISGYETQLKRTQEALNIEAALSMGLLHDQLKENGYEGHELRVMLIRLLFCLFAEDTQIFNDGQLHKLLTQRTREDGSDLAGWISQLFDTLNREKRFKNLDEQLAAFPYINGELFKEAISPAAFDAKMRQELIKACNTDWSTISPEIFGSLFQSVMDTNERRNLGAHYTNEQNILKVINSLFLDDLREEFAVIKANKQVNIRANKLDVFHDKLAKLTFLDPACGCGNFLVVAYRELRLLELEVIEHIQKNSTQLIMDVAALIRCNVNQFYGIEIEEFPSQIARVAMWLVDHQMNLLVSKSFGMHYARIPLKQSAIILNANALQAEWPITDFIFGNPPFLGKNQQSSEQTKDIARIFYDVPQAGNLDFVTGWYRKAIDLVKNTRTCCAFVSTNSITQGEQVPILWGNLLAHGLHIHFAHRTFQWSNEAKGVAAVHCVIIGFAAFDKTEKWLFDYENIKGLPSKLKAININPFLIDAPNVLPTKRSKPLCDVPAMVYGSKPTDGGNLLLNQTEKDELVAKEPQAAEWIKPFLNAEEFINNAKRYCLWLKGCPPDKLRKMPEVSKRVEAVKTFRAASTKAQTRDMAAFATLFGEIRQSAKEYLLIPAHSSENRKYVPIGYVQSDVICGNANFSIPNASLYHFGVMTSLMHNTWMRAVCGRIKSDYRYAAGIVYNNFPWPNPTEKQKQAIETAAQAVLDARLLYPQSSLADLYNPTTMPPELTKAHQQLDKAVDAAYGKTKFNNEPERVAFLFELYQQYTAPVIPIEKAKTKRLPKKQNS